MGNFAMAFIFCDGCCWFSAKITWWWTWVQTFPIRIEMSIPSSIGFRIYLVCIVILASLRNSRFFISLQQVYTMFQMRFHRISIVFFCILILAVVYLFRQPICQSGRSGLTPCFCRIVNKPPNFWKPLPSNVVSPFLWFLNCQTFVFGSFPLTLSLELLLGIVFAFS